MGVSKGNVPKFPATPDLTPGTPHHHRCSRDELTGQIHEFVDELNQCTEHSLWGCPLNLSMNCNSSPNQKNCFCRRIHIKFVCSIPGQLIRLWCGYPLPLYSPLWQRHPYPTQSRSLSPGLTESGPAPVLTLSGSSGTRIRSPDSSRRRSSSAHSS